MDDILKFEVDVSPCHMLVVIDSRSFRPCFQASNFNIKPIACFLNSSADNVLDVYLKLAIFDICDRIEGFVIIENQVSGIVQLLVAFLSNIVFSLFRDKELVKWPTWVNI